MLWIRATESGTQLQISAPKISRGLRKGDSVAVNGCCLTVSSHRDGQLTFDLLGETLERTNLGALRRDSLVNLERALVAGDRLGGHFVQGHIDCTTPVISIEQSGSDFRLEVALPEAFAHYLIAKGSIAINGISLTVAEILPASFVVWIIPHTKRETNLSSLTASDQVNLEFDMLAKYVERLLARKDAPPVI